MTIDQFLPMSETFLQVALLRGSHNGNDTSKSYRVAFRRLHKWLISTGHEWSGQSLAQWQVSMMGELKRPTIENRCACVRSFCKWLSGYEGTENLSHFLEGIRTKTIREEQTARRRVVTQAELDQLRIFAHGAERDVINTLALTGLRSKGFRGLLASDWDQTTNRLHIRKENAKGQKERWIPVSPKLAEILRRNISGERFTHVRQYSKATTLNNLCKRLSEKASIAPFHPHALRHYFGTAMIRHNVNVVVVSRIMGHSSIDITAKLYVHLEETDVDGATNCL
jgi:integrase